MRHYILLLSLTLSAICFSQCDARKLVAILKGKKGLIMKYGKKLKVIKHLEGDLGLDSSNSDPYVNSPFSLPPFDSLGPISLPDSAPPFCVYPPQPPSTTMPTPIGPIPSSSSPPPPPPFFYIPPTLPIQSPPPSPIVAQTPPQITPSPPTTTYLPSPSPPTPGSVLNPPYYEPSPPSYTIPIPSPPSYVPYPGGFSPSPPIFQPPVVYPPPTGPPPRNVAPNIALWCVAKPSVPDPIIKEAMNYACGSGADCDSIQPNSACFEPNTLFAHASFAFNSYWQRTKVAGGTCEFGGTAMLVTVDPSYDGCRFIYY